MRPTITCSKKIYLVKIYERLRRSEMLSANCEDILSNWCRDVRNCPHAASHELFARFDTDARGGPKAWRCYAKETLDDGLRHFLSGSVYCTRDAALRHMAATHCHEDHSTKTASIDPFGWSVHVPASRDLPNSFGAQAGSMLRVDFVVAHCREPLTWLANAQYMLREGYEGAFRASGTSSVPLDISLHVFEKCGEGGGTAWLHSGWANETRWFLENKGEECLAYLTYIVEEYHRLPHYVVFLQGDGLVQRMGTKLANFGRDVVAPQLADVWRSCNDHQYIAIGESEAACTRARMPPGRAANCQVHPLRAMRACMAQMYERHWRMPLPEVVSMYTNAQAGVSRDRIQRRPLDFYRGLLSEFQGPAAKECFKVPGKVAMGAADAEQPTLTSRAFRGTCALFEYLWPSIFGEAAIVDPSHVMSRLDRAPESN